MGKKSEHIITGTLSDDPKLMEYLGINVQRYRVRKNLTKKEFAAILGIGRPTLDAIEKGTYNARLNLVEEMAAALGVERMDLLRSPIEQESPKHL